MTALQILAALLTIGVAILLLRLVFKLTLGTVAAIIGVILAVPLTILMLPITVPRELKKRRQFRNSRHP